MFRWNQMKISEQLTEPNLVSINSNFKICPSCSSKSLKIENGCDMCVECGYSRCDK